MILIADSGSTKTYWMLIDPESAEIAGCLTPGINPYYHDPVAIFETLQKHFTLRAHPCEAIYFYGAGCSNYSRRQTVAGALVRYFSPHALEVESDLMGAARALCGRMPGIACIIGTGSNSCQYNGECIVRQTPAGGFLLGDEGSGADLGRHLVSDLLKNQLPLEISDLFQSVYSLTPQDILEQLYKHPFPNRYLAQFAPFISANIHLSPLKQLAKRRLSMFFERNIRSYEDTLTRPLHFTGSVALAFENLLRELAAGYGYSIDKVSGSPANGLLRYHGFSYSCPKV